MARRRGSKKRARAVREFTDRLHSDAEAPAPAERETPAAIPVSRATPTLRSGGSSSGGKRSLRERSGRGRSGDDGNQTAMYALMGGGGLAVIGLIVVLASSGDAAPARGKETAKKEAPVIDVSWDHPRVQAIAKWANAIGDGLDLELSRFSDIDALRKHLAIETDARDPVALRAAILAGLKTHEKSHVFREFRPVDGRLLDPSMHAGETGAAQLVFTARPGKGYDDPRAEARVTVNFRAEGSGVRVTSFDLDYLPKELKPKPKPKHKPHETIAKPKVIERKFGGETIKITESELVPLDHLPEVPAELRREIDSLIAKMIDLDAPGATFNRSNRRLREIGRPAVPRLLNKMFETPIESREDVLALTRLVGTMRDLTGIAFGFNPADHANSDIGGTDEERISSLKQWYAWWYRNHDAEDFARAIEKSQGEDLFETEAEKEMREASKKGLEEAGSTKGKSKRN